MLGKELRCTQKKTRRAYYDEMVKDERVLTQVVNRLASGKPTLGEWEGICCQLQLSARSTREPPVQRENFGLSSWGLQMQFLATWRGVLSATANVLTQIVQQVPADWQNAIWIWLFWYSLQLMVLAFFLRSHLLKLVQLSCLGMDTGEIPEKVTKRMLDAATKNPSGIREQRHVFFGLAISWSLQFRGTDWDFAVVVDFDLMQTSWCTCTWLITILTHKAPSYMGYTPVTYMIIYVYIIIHDHICKSSHQSCKYRRLGYHMFQTLGISGYKEHIDFTAPRDPSSAKYSVNATVSIMGHALATLKSGAGKPPMGFSLDLPLDHWRKASINHQHSATSMKHPKQTINIHQDPSTSINIHQGESMVD